MTAPRSGGVVPGANGEDFLANPALVETEERQCCKREPDRPERRTRSNGAGDNPEQKTKTGQQRDRPRIQRQVHADAARYEIRASDRIGNSLQRRPLECARDRNHEQDKHGERHRNDQIFDRGSHDGDHRKRKKKSGERL